jgi:hypothetical protein
MGWRIWFGAVCAWAALSGAAAAQHSERELALAREILVLSRSVETMNAMMDTMAPGITADFRSRGVSERDAARMTELFLEEFAAEHDGIIELTAIAYAESFNEEQLTDIRDFLASPSGRAMSAAQPELSAALARAGMVIGEEAGVRAAQRLLDERGENGRLDP